MALQVLVTGDIHVGRSSTRLPESFPAGSARAVNGWQAVVDHAIEHRFDLLLLTGDIADQDNKFWEAVGPLASGIGRLAEHDIQTIAVSGNHDHDVLPRLADQLEGSGAFRLLGREGRWERHSVEVEGRVILHVDGWSFPAPFVDIDPVAEYFSGRPGEGIPVIGLVHGDLDVPASRYAPLSLARLRSQPVDGWVLGHIHKAQLVADAAPFVLYPGSPQAMDFGEPGAHGAWRFRVDAGGVSTPELVPLSCCRYEDVPVEIADAEDEAALERLVHGAVQEVEARCRDESGEILRALVLRLRLTGRSSIFDRVADVGREVSAYTGSLAGLTTRIADVCSEVLPAVDLASLARGTSPLAVAARLLSLLESDPDCEEIRQLVAEARIQIEEVAGGRDYLALHGTAPVDDETARIAVRNQLAFIVGQLLRQQEGAA